ncbi:hypothetical protein B6U66_01330 [Candidatus Bathyarchaeota archaeon ex4484_135]|nr:MAG: hypothetical protein B6U66_01330 [Candidatus Bathyarchaeota archaeon ex4484_135]
MSSARVLPLRLREPRTVLLVLAYLALGSLVELAIVHYGFRSAGLEDVYLVWRLGLWTFFIPLLVILVLVFSLLHLTRSFLVAPREAAKTRRARRARRTGGRRSVVAELTKKIGYLGLSALRSSAVILLGLSIAVMFALLTFYWLEAFELSGSLVKAFPPFHWFITGLSRLVDKLTAVEKLSGAIKKLVETSIKMNNAVRSLAEALGEADPLYKYAFVQNLVAWSSGLSALLYRRPPVLRRRR